MNRSSLVRNFLTVALMIGSALPASARIDAERFERVRKTLDILEQYEGIYRYCGADEANCGYSHKLGIRLAPYTKPALALTLYERGKRTWITHAPVTHGEWDLILGDSHAGEVRREDGKAWESKRLAYQRGYADENSVDWSYSMEQTWKRLLRTDKASRRIDWTIKKVPGSRDLLFEELENGKKTTHRLRWIGDAENPSDPL